MKISWVPGKRIEKLPYIIQPVALLCRNILILVGKGGNRYRESETDVRKKLFFGVEYVCQADVEGDIAEFGTMTGKTATILAAALSRFDIHTSKPRKLHLFDSFEGLPQAESIIDKNSPHVKSGAWGPGTCKGVSKGKLKYKCKKFLADDRIIIYDGWFKDTLFQIPKDVKFSMLHVDCDLYKSTIELLTYLFKNRHIVDGTVVFFHDYNCNKASPNFGERKAWSEAINKFSIVFTDCGEYGWGGRRFIIHHYNAE